MPREKVCRAVALGKGDGKLFAKSLRLLIASSEEIHVTPTLLKGFSRVKATFLLPGGAPSPALRHACGSVACRHRSGNGLAGPIAPGRRRAGSHASDRYCRGDRPPSRHFRRRSAAPQPEWLHGSRRSTEETHVISAPERTLGDSDPFRAGMFRRVLDIRHPQSHISQGPD